MMHNAPAKAQRKHHVIGEIFKSLGYKEVTLPVLLGIRSWLMEYQSNEP